MTYVIAIAGPPGSGKSTLAHALAQALGGAGVLEFDRYEQATARSVDELARWLQEGADFNALAAPGLREDLERLKAAESSPKYLLFEMPLGREHAQTAHLIDFLIWIDLPLDVALARKLHQISSTALHSPTPGEHGKALAWLHGYLDGYLSVVREVLLVQHNRVRSGADVFVDGTADFPRLVAQMAEIIRRSGTRFTESNAPVSEHPR